MRKREDDMDLICLGDSLTFGYGVRRVQRWTTLAEEETGWKLHNYGVCGDTTGGMLARLRELLRQLPGRADERRFLLMGGSNDIFFSGTSASARANMAAMAHQLFAAGEAPIIAVGPGPAGGEYPDHWSALADFRQAEETICEYYAWLERFCDAFGVRMLDFRRDFLDSAGNPRHELYLDGLHPNAEGHRVMAARVAKVIGVMERERMNA